MGMGRGDGKIDLWYGELYKNRALNMSVKHSVHCGPIPGPCQAVRYLTT